MRADQRLGNAYGIVLCCLVLADCSQHEPQRGDDQALEAQYAEIVGKLGNLLLPGEHEHEYETCISEMVRRGGEHWVAFLRRELDLLREREQRRKMSEPRELVLLTALRRAERKPDPLAIEFDTHSVRAVTFPRLPTISFQLKNVDVSELFSLSGGAIFGFGGRYQCYRIDATDPRGVHLAPLPNPLFSCVGSVHEVTLAPGEVLDPELDLDLTQYVAAPQPGEYRVCVQFHSEENIAGAAGVEGWILATSQSFVVRLDPLSVRLSAHEVASMKEWIAAIDVQDQVLLIREHWSPGLTFFGEPTSAADRLFRAGWNGLPVLLEALDDEHLAQGRRACIVALLWDIAGIFDPSSDPGGVEDLYIGPWSERWPSTLKESAQMRSEFADRDQAEWAKRIAAFSDRWRALRSCVQLEIID